METFLLILFNLSRGKSARRLKGRRGPSLNGHIYGIRTCVQERSDNVSTSVFDRRANVLADALHLCSGSACGSEYGGSGRRVARRHRAVISPSAVSRTRAGLIADLPHGTNSRTTRPQPPRTSAHARAIAAAP